MINCIVQIGSRIIMFMRPKFLRNRNVLVAVLSCTSSLQHKAFPNCNVQTTLNDKHLIGQGL